jgi:DNA-binding NarL/FixJ family response regulator
MYKILFIDEEKDVFDDFLDYVEASPIRAEFRIETELPLSNLEEMLDVVMKHSPDALVTDFMLNEAKTDIKYNVPYNGSAIVKAFTEIRQDFPCFILTSFDDQAINQSRDVNIVYIKNILHGEAEKKTKARASFLERIKSQVNHYRTRLEETENRLLELIQLREHGSANIVEENEIIKLDSFLESSIDNKNIVPPDFKQLSNTQRLEQLLSKVDEMLNIIESGDGK